MLYDAAAIEATAEVLKRPSPLLQLVVPGDPYAAPLADELARRLVESRLYLSDEYRTEEYVTWLIDGWFKKGGPTALVYRVGIDGGLLGGVMAFQNIMPGWKCGLMAKIWERKLWGPQLVREVRGLLALIEYAFALERIEIDTADLRMVRLGRMMGFENEGVRARAFRWGGEPFDVYELARLRMEHGGQDGK